MPVSVRQSASPETQAKRLTSLKTTVSHLSQ